MDMVQVSELAQWTCQEVEVVRAQVDNQGINNMDDFRL